MAFEHNGYVDLEEVLKWEQLPNGKTYKIEGRRIIYPERRGIFILRDVENGLVIHVWSCSRLMQEIENFNNRKREQWRLRGLKIPDYEKYHKRFYSLGGLKVVSYGLRRAKECYGGFLYHNLRVFS